MREDQIKVSHFSFETITECSCRKAFGEHGCLTIKGIIRQGLQEEYLKAGQMQEKIQVTVEELGGGWEH